MRDWLRVVGLVILGTVMMTILTVVYMIAWFAMEMILHTM